MDLARVFVVKQKSMNENLRIRNFAQLRSNLHYPMTQFEFLRYVRSLKSSNSKYVHHAVIYHIDINDTLLPDAFIISIEVRRDSER